MKTMDPRPVVPRLVLPAIALVGVMVPAHGGSDPACQPVIDADKARAAAPAWHTRKTMGAMRMEIIRSGTEVYANVADTGWKRMPPAMAAGIVDAGNQADRFAVTDCQKLGDESVDGVSTAVWSFKVADGDKPPYAGRVWIGHRDGLPYREEGEHLSGTTVYDGITAPSP